MIFTTLYRGSFYLMLTMATMTMSVDATDSKISMLFPLASAAAGFLALVTVDRNPRLGLTRPAANALALVSIGLVMLEYVIDPAILLHALAHALVYLQLIKMFLPKMPEDDWFLVLLGLMQVLVGAVISQSDRVGTFLFLWAFLTLWVLCLFSLHRDALRYRAISDTRVPGAALADKSAGPAGTLEPSVLAQSQWLSEEPYPGLFNLAFVMSGLRVTALTLALGGVIFLCMPRRGTAAKTLTGSDPISAHLTGFDDEVKLGQLGEILENESVVMSVELYDYNVPARKIRPSGEPLWRGVTMATYDQGRWHRSGKELTTVPLTMSHNATETIRQDIKLESTDSPVLFGLRPITSIRMATATRNGPEFNMADGTFVRGELRHEAVDYVVESDADLRAPQSGEREPSARRLADLLEVPDTMRDRLRAIAEPLVKDIPRDDREARAKALERYLLVDGKFSYTLHMDVQDATIDPVLDFLINRKQGHCEYFASALTLMLRSIGVPARMVNGFKGGDWNELAQVLSVREKHAHSWVEAYLGSKDFVGPLWLTLDPTPAVERQRSLEQVTGFKGHFRQFTDFVRYVWVFFVVGYNADRQNRLVYEPIQQLVREARSGFAMMGQAIRPALSSLFDFKDIGQFISWRGFFVSFSALLLLAGVVRLIVWITMRIVRWLRGPDRDELSLSAGVVFYRRLTQLLAQYGLERPPAETQQEFARRAIVFLTGGGSRTESVADVPRLVVDSFYRVRFGHLTLTPERLKQLEARLDALEASLHSRGS